MAGAAILCAAVSIASVAGAGAARTGVPEALQWAYAPAPPGTPEYKLPPGAYKAPNGAVLTAAQVEKMELRDMDWAPAQHPKALAIIVGPTGKDGPAPCGECHGIAGAGIVNIPDLAGLPADYIVAQAHAFRSGARRSTEPERYATQVMIKVAKAASEAQLREATAYFAKTPRHPRVTVIEGDAGPVTRTERFGWSYRAGTAMKPLRGRIVEVPESVERTFLYDTSMRQLAYAPRGAVARGASLVKTGGKGGQPCAACHGPALKGAGLAPPLAGRSPSYLARQLWDIRSGARADPGAALMKGPASGLSPADVTAVAAYLASLPV